MCLVRFLLLLAVITMVGCGGPDAGVSVDPSAAPSGAAFIKTALEEVAQSGELGSGAMEIRDNLEQLKSTDAATAEGLLADMDELESLSGAKAIKAKAKEMADKL